MHFVESAILGVGLPACIEARKDWGGYKIEGLSLTDVSMDADHLRVDLTDGVNVSLGAIQGQFRGFNCEPQRPFRSAWRVLMAVAVRFQGSLTERRCPRRAIRAMRTRRSCFVWTSACRSRRTRAAANSPCALQDNTQPHCKNTTG